MRKAESKMRNIPKAPKRKMVQKANVLGDIIMQVGPHAGEIAEYGIKGIGAFGAGVYGYGIAKGIKNFHDAGKNLHKFMGRGRKK